MWLRARVLVRGRKPDYSRFIGRRPHRRRHRLGNDRIWYSNQCLQPGQHAHHFGHDRGRERPDPDRTCAYSCQLRRIAEVLRGKVLARVPSAVESTEAAHRRPPRDAGAGRDPALDPRTADPRAAPRARTACDGAPLSGHGHRTGARSAGLAACQIQAHDDSHAICPGAARRARTADVELTDEAPLSPRPPQRPAMPPAVEPTLEPKVWSPSRDSGSLEPRLAPRSEQPVRAPRLRSSRRRKRNGSIWCGRIAAPHRFRMNPRSRSSASRQSTCRCRRSGPPTRDPACHREAHARNAAQAASRTGTRDP